MIEALCHFLSKWQKARDGGALAAESMLGFRQREMKGELGEEQALKHFDRGTEK